jgi:malonate transporter and related proteins
MLVCMQNALLLIPDFATILLGAALRRWMPLNDDFWTGMEKLIYYVLFPALLFNALIRTRIDFITAGPLVLGGICAVGTGILLGLLAFRLFALAPMELASRFQCAFRFNSYVGLAIVSKIYGETGIAAMSILLGAMVPLVNTAAIGILVRHGQFIWWRELLRNPLVIATAAGLAWNVAALPTPEPAAQFLTRLSEATVATGLLTVGAALRWRVKLRSAASDSYYLATKLLAVPLAAWWVGRWLGLSPMYAGVLVIFASLPVANSAYILAARMGGDGPGVAWLISTSTLLAMVTMSFWLNLIT